MQRLAEHGYRSTGPRHAVADAIAARTGQFTSRELVEELEPQGIGRATVFRVLDLLVQMRLLERLHTELACHSYMYCELEHHHHLVCTSCGRVISIAAGSVERELRNLARRINFRPERHHVELYGQCEACHANN
jgi:Fur family ferric uptake transcriptional regulator